LRFDFEDKNVIVPFNKDQVKNAPNFTEKELNYGKFSEYWDELAVGETYAHTER